MARYVWALRWKDNPRRLIVLTARNTICPCSCPSVVDIVSHESFFLQVVQVRQQAVAKRKENKHAVALDCDQVDTRRL